jgi:hypothetical protein
MKWYTSDSVDVVDGSVHTIRKNTEALVIASKEIGLEVNAQKTKYMVMSRDQMAGQNHTRKIGNKFFERMEQLKVSGGGGGGAKKKKKNIKKKKNWGLGF